MPDAIRNRKLILTHFDASGYKFVDANAEAYYDAMATAYGGNLDASIYSLTLDQLKEGIDLDILNNKSGGVWSNLTRYYPFIGGTAATHAINAVSAASELSYVGSPTHGAQGTTLNGVSQYAKMNNTPSADCAPGDAHIMIFPNVTSGNTFSVGSRDSSANALFLRAFGGTTKQTDNLDGVTGNGRLTVASGVNLSKVHISSRTTTTLLHMYVDGSSIGNNTGPSLSSAGSTYGSLIGAWDNVGSPIHLLQGDLKAGSIGYGLTGAEASSFTNNLNTLNTLLGR